MSRPAAAESRRGLIFALGSYLIWGLLPLYFALLVGLNAFEIVAWRILLTLVFCALLLTVTRGWAQVAAVFRDRAVLGRLALAGAVIYVNWQTYVIASVSGHILDASLGYFINPVVTILLAVIILGERLSPVQWVALAVTVLAFAVIAIGYGTFPWIALLLALSFGVYGFLKKGIGNRVGALPGLFVETVVLTPVALVILGVLAGTRGLDVASASPGLIAVLALSGAVTGLPLILFAAGARRLSLTALGFTQYLAPSLMFLVGWLVLGEQVPVARWVGFALVWGALIVLSVETL
ncbi:EamA family transporter RarD, partial [Leucobacter sp. M11]|uniref:EamA family transporter RarD n=1 Tax=Leucobacter sp. M11 TaxID=2993565 RepID=UPI002D7E8D5D